MTIKEIDKDLIGNYFYCNYDLHRMIKYFLITYE